MEAYSIENINQYDYILNGILKENPNLLSDLNIRKCDIHYVEIVHEQVRIEDYKTMYGTFYTVFDDTFDKPVVNLGHYNNYLLVAKNKLVVYNRLNAGLAVFYNIKNFKEFKIEVEV